MQWHPPEDPDCFWPSGSLNNCVMIVWKQYQQSMCMSQNVWYQLGHWETELRGVCQCLPDQHSWPGYCHLGGNSTFFNYDRMIESIYGLSLSYPCSSQKFSSLLSARLLPNSWTHRALTWLTSRGLPLGWCPKAPCGSSIFHWLFSTLAVSRRVDVGLSKQCLAPLCFTSNYGYGYVWLYMAKGICGYIW